MKYWRLQFHEDRHMKKLKELADKNNAEILDKEFLENTLYPIVDANKAKRKRKLIPATATVICCVLLFSIGIGIGITYNRNYAESYATEKSDIDSLNANLSETQLIGDFETITLTYEVRRQRPVYFSVYREEADTERLQSISVRVIVKQDYEIQEAKYLKQFEFLGYTVHYNETNNFDSSAEQTLYEYTANAFMDTGAERYVIEYTELCLEENFHFAEYLQGIIKQK